MKACKKASYASCFRSDDHGNSIRVNGRGISLLDAWWRKLDSACAICDLRAENGRICSRCRDILPWNDICCGRCGQPLPSRQPAGIDCDSCQAGQPPFAKARAPLLYEFPVDAIIKAVKFRRQLAYVPALTEILLQALETEFPGVDALLPVPLHRLRRLRRGFNQAMELARPLRRATALPVLVQAKRTRATLAQTGLNAGERKKNLQGAFTVSGRLTCRHPLIVDDVITTGETCSQLARALLNSGATEVSVLAVAHAAISRDSVQAGQETTGLKV